MTTSYATRTAAAALAVLLLLSGCGDDEPAATGGTRAATTSPEMTSESTPEPSGSEDVCAARDDLEQSVQALGGVDVVAGGTDALEAGLQDVQDDLATLRGAAGDDLDDEVSALETAVDDLRGTLDGATEPAAGERLTALAAVVTAGGALVAALQDLPCDK